MKTSELVEKFTTGLQQFQSSLNRLTWTIPTTAEHLTAFHQALAIRCRRRKVMVGRRHWKFSQGKSR